MTSPWSGLDADTANKRLYLDPGVIAEVERVYTPYDESLQALINDSLDETTGYFGTPDGKNPLAVLLQKLFDERGKLLTDYLKEQQTQAHDFVKTARDAAEAMRTAQND
jgi:hypothetical protein